MTRTSIDVMGTASVLVGAIIAVTAVMLDERISHRAYWSALALGLILILWPVVV